MTNLIGLGLTGKEESNTHLNPSECSLLEGVVDYKDSAQTATVSGGSNTEPTKFSDQR